MKPPRVGMQPRTSIHNPQIEIDPVVVGIGALRLAKEEGDYIAWERLRRWFTPAFEQSGDPEAARLLTIADHRAGAGPTV